MGSYSRVKRRFWNDEQVQQLSWEARYLMLYLLTSPHGNGLGLYVLREGYATEDLGWDAKRFRERFAELLAKGLVKHDPTTNLLFIPRYLKHNPLENSNQVKAMLKVVDELPASPLWIQAAQAVEQFCKQFAKPLAERLRNGMPITGSVTVTVDRISPPTPPLGGDANGLEDVQDKKGSAGSIDASDETETEPPNERDPAREFWQYFCDVWKDVYPEGPRWTDARRKKIRARLRRFSLDELKRACDNLHASPFARGENDRGWVADIDYLIRNDENVDKWLRRPSARDAPTLFTDGGPFAPKTLGG